MPVVLHLDHCKDIAMIEKCAATGWTSIMIDASEFPFEENLEMSKRVRDIAEKYGVGMEAELGQIMGVEDDMVVAEEDSVLTDPEDAKQVLRRAGPVRLCLCRRHRARLLQG